MDPLNLITLLPTVEATGPEGLRAVVTGIAYRSDRVRPGDAFFCVPGFVHDGHEFAAAAAAADASVLVVQHRVDVPDVPQVVVPDTRLALALASSAFFGHPSRSMELVAVTGTNGKTTSTYIVDAVLRAAGHTTGLIGTVETRIAGSCERASRTTPESRDLQALLAHMVEEGVDAAVMEVSSHAIDLHRVDGCEFAVAAFTNLSQDHLDYHPSIEEYFSVKARLFSGMPVRSRVVNIDDAYGRRLVEQVGAEWTVGTSPEAAVRAEDVILGPRSTSFELVTPDGVASVTLQLTGAFNVSNALVAAGCGLALGIPIAKVASGLEGAPQVPGRLERIDVGQPFDVFVDYAHTPDGLEKAVDAVRQVTSGRVITVFGCGGDRDPAKRPLMGHAAACGSDVAVLTSDNPRSEDPVGIILQVEDGMTECRAEKHVEVDRRSAIALAVSLAKPGDSVLIAGKGHEDYQIFEDRTIHFDDREVACEELRRLC